MDIIIKSSLYEERDLLRSVLNKLDEQHKLLTSTDKDFILINNVADEIDNIVKSIAIIELERRKTISNEELVNFVKNSNDSNLKSLLDEIHILNKSIKTQNEQNIVFIKQNLFFTRKMIKMITPSQQFDTYNASGRLGGK